MPDYIRDPVRSVGRRYGPFRLRDVSGLHIQDNAEVELVFDLREQDMTEGKIPQIHTPYGYETLSAHYIVLDEFQGGAVNVTLKIDDVAINTPVSVEGKATVTTVTLLEVAQLVSEEAAILTATMTRA